VISTFQHFIELILNFIAQAIQHRVKPGNPSLFTGTILDLTHSRSELVLENAFLRVGGKTISVLNFGPHSSQSGLLDSFHNEIYLNHIENSGFNDFRLQKTFRMMFFPLHGVFPIVT
jgi:hypothetical protein